MTASIWMDWDYLTGQINPGGVAGWKRGHSPFLDMKLGEIARRFGLKHYASAGASIRQFEARLAKTGGCKSVWS